MDTQTAATLCKLNDDFYRRVGASFSDTRHGAWRGWRRCMDAMGVGDAAGDGAARPVADGAAEPTADGAVVARPVAAGAAEPTSVFDLACGNLRFEAFLADEFSEARFDFHAVDDCDALVQDAPMRPAVRYQSLDVLGALLAGGDLPARFTAPICDIAVSFGFMHHVPDARLREKVLAALVAQTAPGGYVAVSFWQFMNSDELAGKARATTERAADELGLPALDAGDFILGWQDVEGAWRYCHNFTDAEIDGLVASVAAQAIPVARFKSDGRTDNLNVYVVLRANV